MYDLIIADDEELEREALRLFVKQSGIDVNIIRECANGTELIKSCAEQQPDIIILDINMPGLNGLEALKMLRTADCNALIIISSAYDHFEYAVTAMQLGVINFLVKPVSKSVFTDAVAKAVELLQNGSYSTPFENAPMTLNHEIPENIQRVVDFLELNYYRQIGLDDIAENCCYSKFHLSHFFKEYTGRTITDSLLFIRIKKAKELLQTSNLSVKEISVATGFADPNYFSSVFKKNTGLTPIQYRGSIF
jgi:two-component system, response regulator YesN